MRARPQSLAASLTAAVALAGGLLVAVPAPAHAAAVSNAGVGASRFINEVGPATCSVANGSDSGGAPFTSNGATVTHTESGTAQLADTGDAGDTVTVAHAVTSRVRATESAGRLTSVRLDASVDATVTAAQGSGTDCDVQLSSSSQLELSTTLGTARWVTIEARLPTNTTMQVVFQRTTPAAPFSQVLVLAGNAKGKATAELLLPAGAYDVGGGLQHTFSSPQAPGEPSSVDVDASALMTFHAPGSAVAEAVGARFASLRSAVDCGTGRLKGRFVKAAGTQAEPALKKAVFKVGGERSKVVQKPRAGVRFTLKDLPREDEVTVTGVFSLVGGGKQTLTRTYRACG